MPSVLLSHRNWILHKAIGYLMSLAFLSGQGLGRHQATSLARPVGRAKRQRHAGVELISIGFREIGQRSLVHQGRIRNEYASVSTQ